MLKNIKMAMGFLTRIPVKVEFESFESIAKKMWQFPFVGFIIGLIVGSIGMLLEIILPPNLAGFIILAIILLITGVHHTDGLFDFGDGLMVIGPPEKKIKVMHDVAIGAGGLTLGLMVIICTGIAIGSITENLLITVCMAEINAKYSIQMACAIGKSAKTKTASSFIELNNKKHLFYSSLLTILLLIILIYLINPLILNMIQTVSFDNIMITLSLSISRERNLIYLICFIITSILSVGIINHLSNKHFNGLTGDCLGALHEISRLFFLISIIIIGKLL